ncbi:hypothetical protein HDU76_000770 [Blyttiomyces sp. JEL0837]|nr:hypothetical protein HDU76_000770 [Blyttiomyces sp. JEL0837]
MDHSNRPQTPPAGAPDPTIRSRSPAPHSLGSMSLGRKFSRKAPEIAALKAAFEKDGSGSVESDLTLPPGNKSLVANGEDVYSSGDEKKEKDSSNKASFRKSLHRIMENFSFPHQHQHQQQQHQPQVQSHHQSQDLSSSHSSGTGSTSWDAPDEPSTVSAKDIKRRSTGRMIGPRTSHSFPLHESPTATSSSKPQRPASSLSTANAFSFHHAHTIYSKSPTKDGGSRTPPTLHSPSSIRSSPVSPDAGEEGSVSSWAQRQPLANGIPSIESALSAQVKQGSTLELLPPDADKDEADVVVAVFLARFDTLQGNMIEYKYPPEIDLSGVEYQSIPSGAHILTNDVIYFRKSEYYGICAFSRHVLPQDEAGREKERGARIRAVGVLSASYTGLHRHLPFLREMAGFFVANEGSYDALKHYYEDQLRTRVPRVGLVDSVGLRDLQSEHPVAHFYQFVNHFGSNIFTLWKSVLLQKRILFYAIPPVERQCYNIFCMQLLGSHSVPGTFHIPSQPMFFVNVADITQLSNLRTFTACTTESIFASKPQLWDLYVPQAHPPQIIFTTQPPKANHSPLLPTAVLDTLSVHSHSSQGSSNSLPLHIPSISYHTQQQHQPQPSSSSTSSSHSNLESPSLVPSPSGSMLLRSNSQSMSSSGQVKLTPNDADVKRFGRMMMALGGDGSFGDLTGSIYGGSGFGGLGHHGHHGSAGCSPTSDNDDDDGPDCEAVVEVSVLEGGVAGETGGRRSSAPFDSRIGGGHRPALLKVLDEVLTEDMRLSVKLVHLMVIAQSEDKVVRSCRIKTVLGLHPQHDASFVRDLVRLYDIPVEVEMRGKRWSGMVSWRGQKHDKCECCLAVLKDVAAYVG